MLRDGRFFVQMIESIISTGEYDVNTSSFIENVNNERERFEFVRFIIENIFNIDSINYERAMSGCEIQLLKISLILLLNGVSKAQNPKQPDYRVLYSGS